MATIITAALNGSTIHRGQCPTVPYTPQEIAAEAESAWSAGASVIHLFAREDGGGPSYRVERIREVIAAVRERCPAIISTSTTLLGVSIEERAAALEARPDLCVIPVGAMTVARPAARGPGFDYDRVFNNRFQDVVHLVGRARELGVRVVCECHDLGHVAAMRRLIANETVTPASVRQLTLGVLGGAPATTNTLTQLADGRPGDGPWQVAAADGSWHLRMGALSMGGHLRVGFQDGWVLPSGEIADSNAALVEAAAAMVRALGAEPATIDEAKALLRLE